MVPKKGLILRNFSISRSSVTKPTLNACDGWLYGFKAGWWTHNSSLHRLSIYNFMTIINQWTVTVQVFTRLLQTIWLVSTFLDHKPEVNASLCDPFPHSPSTLICNLSELCYVWTVWYAPLGTAQCWTFSHCSINWLYLPTLHNYRTLLHQLTVPSHPS